MRLTIKHLSGTDENAVYIALALAGLNDNFELDDFDNRKQGILNALVACSPRQTAPCVARSIPLSPEARLS